MLIKTVAPTELELDRRELAARLGNPDATLDGLEGLYNELMSASRPAYAATRVKFKAENGTVSFGGESFDSTALCKFLGSDGECVMLAATLGIGVDRLVMKRAQTSAAEAFLIDAIADVLIESLCDMAERDLAPGIEARGRFSPGYADLDISAGYEILRLTDAERRLGIKLTEGGLMIPKKSVNAIIAVNKREGV